MPKTAFQKAVDQRISRLEEEGEVVIWNHIGSVAYYDEIVSMGMATRTDEHGGQVIRYTWQEPAPQQLSFIAGE